MEDKKIIKISLGTVICILIIILLLAISSILIYKIKDIEKTSNFTIENLKAEKEVLENVNKNDSNIDTNSALNMTYIKKLGKNGTLTLPQINEDTEGAKSINAKINKLYSLDEIHGVSATEICTESISYKDKNLIGIFLNLEDSTDNGIAYYFYYDLDTKKEFTLKDIIEDEGFSLSDINKKYQETLDEGEELWDRVEGKNYIITGEEMFYTRNEQSEEVGHYVNTLYIVIPIDKAYLVLNKNMSSINMQYKYIDGYFSF